MMENFPSTQPDQKESGIFCTYCIHTPVPAVISCLMCDASMCDNHLRVHSKASEHVLCDPTTSPESRKCSVHKKILEYYCTKDSACICVYCRLDGEHWGHQVETLHEASEMKKKKLRDVQQKLMAEREETEKRVQSLQEHRRNIQGKAADAKERVTALIRDLRRQLEDLEKRVLSDLSGQAERLSLPLDELIQQLEIKKDELFRKMEDIEELCNMTDPLTVLQRSDTECNSANSGSGHLNVLPTTPMYENAVNESSRNPPTTFISQHGALTSFRSNHIFHGSSCFGRLLPALLVVLLLMCVTLQSVLMFLRVSGGTDQSSSCKSSPINGSSGVTEQSSSSKSSPINGSSGCSLICPDLWILINDKCYFLSEDKQSRAQSEADCTERGSRLAMVKERTIRRLVTITGQEFWVGLSKYNHHGGVWTGKWADGSMENVTEGTGGCAKLRSRLTLENCYTDLHWICEREIV